MLIMSNHRCPLTGSETGTPGPQREQNLSFLPGSLLLFSGANESLGRDKPFPKGTSWPQHPGSGSLLKPKNRSFSGLWGAVFKPAPKLKAVKQDSGLFAGLPGCRGKGLL